MGPAEIPGDHIGADCLQQRAALPSFWVSNAINSWAGRISGLPAALAACNAAVGAAWVLVVGLNESTTVLRSVRKGCAKCLSRCSTPSRLSLFRSTLTFFPAPRRVGVESDHR